MQHTVLTFAPSAIGLLRWATNDSVRRVEARKYRP